VQDASVQYWSTVWSLDAITVKFPPVRKKAAPSV